MHPAPIEILGVRVHPLTVADLHHRLAEFIDGDQHALVFHANVHGINLAAENPSMRAALEQAEIVFCDGAGVILGARLLGHHIPERITYADWMWQVAEFAEQRGYSMFFLGARPGVARAAADRLLDRYPTLRIAGVRDGYFDKTPGHPENEAVVECINHSRPNILIAGMGMPIQEQWLCANWPRLNVNVALTGGAVFDYLSGELQRAPSWMTGNGFEWLGRLLIEPRRLWRRYLVGNPIFLSRVLKERFIGRR